MILLYVYIKYTWYLCRLYYLCQIHSTINNLPIILSLDYRNFLSSSAKVKKRKTNLLHHKRCNMCMEQFPHIINDCLVYEGKYFSSDFCLHLTDSSIISGHIHPRCSSWFTELYVLQLKTPLRTGTCIYGSWARQRHLCLMLTSNKTYPNKLMHFPSLCSAAREFPSNL